MLSLRYVGALQQQNLAGPQNRLQDHCRRRTPNRPGFLWTKVTCLPHLFWEGAWIPIFCIHVIEMYIEFLFFIQPHRWCNGWCAASSEVDRGFDSRLGQDFQSNWPQVKTASKWKSNRPHILNIINKIWINIFG